MVDRGIQKALKYNAFSRKKGGRRRAPKPAVAEIPFEILRRRAEAAPMPTDRLDAGDQSVLLRVRHDGAMVSALGRVMWAFDAHGRRQRRLLSYGPQCGREPLISDGMELAALTYQRIYTEWRTECDLPAATVQANDYSAIKVDCSSAGVQNEEENRVDVDGLRSRRATQRLQRVVGLLAACPASGLVRKVVDMVVVEDVFVPLLLERQAALESLRIGLQALEAGLLLGPGGGRRRRIMD
jgi:hypothetical protein